MNILQLYTSECKHNSLFLCFIILIIWCSQFNLSVTHQTIYYFTFSAYTCNFVLWRSVICWPRSNNTKIKGKNFKLSKQTKQQRKWKRKMLCILCVNQYNRFRCTENHTPQDHFSLSDGVLSYLHTSNDKAWQGYIYFFPTYFTTSLNFPISCTHFDCASLFLPQFQFWLNFIPTQKSR